MAKTTKPIKPSEVVQKKASLIPDIVIEAFNQLILENYSDGLAKVRQEDVVELLVQAGHNADVIFAKGWLNVESIYREAGWKVQYDKPACNESFPATFKFSIK